MGHIECFQMLDKSQCFDRLTACCLPSILLEDFMGKISLSVPKEICISCGSHIYFCEAIFLVLATNGNSVRRTW